MSKNPQAFTNSPFLMEVTRRIKARAPDREAFYFLGEDAPLQVQTEDGFYWWFCTGETWEAHYYRNNQYAGKKATEIPTNFEDADAAASAILDAVGEWERTGSC